MLQNVVSRKIKICIIEKSIEDGFHRELELRRKEMLERIQADIA